MTAIHRSTSAARPMRLLGVAMLAISLVACSSGRRSAPQASIADSTFVQLCRSADQSLIEQGQPKLAYSLYAQALTRGHLTNDPVAIAIASYGQAASLARMRRFAEAFKVLNAPGDEVPAAYRTPRHLLAARMHLELADGDRALNELDHAEASSETASRGSTNALIQLTRGQIAVLVDDLASASALLDRTPEELPASLLAQRHRLAGMIADAKGDSLEAAAAFEAEAAAARHASNWPGVAEATARAAEAYRSGRDFSSAARSFFQASRSAALQPETHLPAEDWMNNAIDAARQSGDKALIDLVASTAPAATQAGD